MVILQSSAHGSHSCRDPGCPAPSLAFRCTPSPLPDHPACIPYQRLAARNHLCLAQCCRETLSLPARPLTSLGTAALRAPAEYQTCPLTPGKSEAWWAPAWPEPAPSDPSA